MNLQMGIFALNQVLASFVVIGPILVLIGLISLKDRKRNSVYVGMGLVLTLMGSYFLYSNLIHRHGETLAESPEIKN
jgi:hypothetical protein